MSQSTTPRPRAVLYARVSTDKQAARGVSLATQEQMARDRCAQMGWDLADVYVDVMSGRSDKRPELTRLLEDAKKRGRPFEVVIFYKIDRIARRARFWYNVLGIFEDHQIQFLSLTQPIDDTKHGRFILGQHILVAELESDNISERVSDNMRMLASTGRHVSGGRVPLGFRLVPGHTTEDGEKVHGHLLVDEAEADLVREAFDTFLRLRSIRGTCDALNRAGHRTRSGAVFRVDGIRRILTNAAYIGTLVYGKHKEQGTTRRRVKQPQETWLTVELAYPVIVAREKWEAAQTALDAQVGMHSRVKFARRHYPWSGLLECAGCGRNLVRHRQTCDSYVGYIYLCNHYARGGKVACADYGRLNVRFLDDAVLPAIARVVHQAADLGKVKQQKRPRKETATNSRALLVEQLQRQRAKANQLWFEDEWTDEQRDQALADIDRQLELLATPEPAAAEPAPMPELPRDLLEFWAGLEDADRSELLRMLVRRAVVSREAIALHLVPYEHPAWPAEPLVIPIQNMRHFRK